jgi:radical SAM protein with 4Fe4S-binding SPASM domain
MKLLTLHGGCSAGTKFSNVGPTGDVHPCQFWQDETIGNIRQQPFSVIWNQPHPLMDKLRNKPDNLKGKCGGCDFKAICAGCRIRAKSLRGDIWDEDPACYLTNDKIHMPKKDAL